MSPDQNTMDAIPALKLDQEEIALRQQLADVAALRRQLPPGGLVPEDYVFETIGRDGNPAAVRLSELFSPGKDSLILYSFMFGPDAANPCSSCNSIIDGLDGALPHIRERVNVAVVAKTGIGRFMRWGHRRGWRHTRLLSAAQNSYNRDYHAETDTGAQLPVCNVFVRSADGIRHFWSSELLFAPLEGHPRHVDLLWPVWNAFDLTPEGRGQDWEPQLRYG